MLFNYNSSIYHQYNILLLSTENYPISFAENVYETVTFMPDCLFEIFIIILFPFKSTIKFSKYLFNYLQKYYQVFCIRG